MRPPVFPRVCDYRIHLVVRAISLTLKLLELLRCDAPVSSTLAWWQRLLTHVSESLRTISLIQATTSLPILWSIEWTPLFSPQAEYRFTFPSRYIMNSNRAPKQWTLAKNETITTFEAWTQNLQYSLSLHANFAPFLADNFTWLKKSATAPNRAGTRAWWRRRSYHSPTYCLSEKLTPWAHVRPDSQLLPTFAPLFHVVQSWKIQLPSAPFGKL